jgi:FtsH-binding integral membrane protein
MFSFKIIHSFIKRGNMNTYYKNSTVNTISDASYHLIIGLTLMWGFAANFLILSVVPVEVIKSIPTWLIIIGFLVSSFAGQYIYNKSDNPTMSFLGYNLVVLPVGILITPLLASIDANIVIDAFLQMTLITGVMMVLGTVYPKFFERIIGITCLAALALIISQLFLVFVLGDSLGVWYHYVIVVVMSIFIGFHWGEGMSKERTVDNAIDTGADVYLPMINILLSILGIKTSE